MGIGTFCRFDNRLLPGGGWNHPARGSKRSSNLQNVPMPIYGYEPLMMGGKAARNM